MPDEDSSSVTARPERRPRKNRAPARPRNAFDVGRGLPDHDKLAPVLKKIYDQMSEPKWVISMGVCASTGGFYRAYHVVQGIDEIVPVDVYVAGCPPTPENLIHGIMELQKKIQSGELARHRASKTFVPIRVGTDPDMSIPPTRTASWLADPERKSCPRLGRRPSPSSVRRPGPSAPEAAAAS